MQGRISKDVQEKCDEWKRDKRNFIRREEANKRMKKGERKKREIKWRYWR